MNKFINYLNDINDKKMILYTLLWEIDTVIDDDYSSYNIEVASKLETEIFEMSTSNEYITLLDEFISSKDFNELAEYKKIYYLSLKDDYEKEKRIPKDFYNDYCIQKNISKKAWVHAPGCPYRVHFHCWRGGNTGLSEGWCSDCLHTFVDCHFGRWRLRYLSWYLRHLDLPEMEQRRCGVLGRVHGKRREHCEEQLQRIPLQ